jgi:two-component system NtrC family sensor kinase
MKIVHKIMWANIINIIFIALVYLFAVQFLELILAKLQFVEIADDLNASFLEMRLSEKNYFLYGDKSVLKEIKGKLDESINSITSVQDSIVRAVGDSKYKELRRSVEDYKAAIQQVAANIASATEDTSMQETVRDSGRKLREFSAKIVSLERKKVNDIISHSKKVLFYFFCVAILIAMAATYLFFSKFLRSLKGIEKTATCISQGDFCKVEGTVTGDELGSVMAAINSMSEELDSRYEQIVQSRKLASLGILTAGVAHELGNPLNNIALVAQTYLELADSLSKEDTIDYMRTIEEETNRIEKIVQDLLHFSKPKQPNSKETEVNSVVEKSFKLVHNMLHVSGIDARLNLQEGLPHVFIDEDRIQEVIVNLIINAIEVMSPGGVISLKTYLEEKGDYVVIEVEDTGEGITAEHLPHIFDPFFSTKGVRGTGLGLSVSYGIIKNHKGNMKVESKEGVGTTFFIELPVHRLIA